MKKSSQPVPRGHLWREVKRHASVYALMVLPVLFLLLFRYMPIWNGQIAFKDFMPLQGVLGSPWAKNSAGSLDLFKYFKDFATSYYFVQLLRNTLFYSFGKLILSIPLAILLSVAIYESIRPRFAKVVQTLSYLPHFLSWVIVYGILQVIIGPGNESVLNAVVVGLGGQPVSFLTSTTAFPWVVLVSDSWKEMGWTAILFIAALMGVDPSLFEAAVLDGASAAKRTWHITLPSIRPVIVMVVLLRIGTILSAGFNQIFMLYNPTVYSVADIIDTWVYRQGLLNFQFSLATAVGIFKGVIGLLLLLFSNWATKKFSDSGVF